MKLLAAIALTFCATTAVAVSPAELLTKLPPAAVAHIPVNARLDLLDYFAAGQTGHGVESNGGGTWHLTVLTPSCVTLTGQEGDTVSIYPLADADGDTLAAVVTTFVLPQHDSWLEVMDLHGNAVEGAWKAPSPREWKQHPKNCAPIFGEITINGDTLTVNGQSQTPVIPTLSYVWNRAKRKFLYTNKK